MTTPVSGDYILNENVSPYREQAMKTRKTKTYPLHEPGLKILDKRKMQSVAGGFMSNDWPGYAGGHKLFPHAPLENQGPGNGTHSTY